MNEGEELYPCSSDDTGLAEGQADAFVIVLSGRLDVFWDGDDNSFQELIGDNDLDESTNAAYDSVREEKLSLLRKLPLAVLRRGQTFGDQMIGLALDTLYPGSQLTTTSVPIRIIAGGVGTEIMWITREFYQDHLREDRVSLSYYPLSSLASPTQFAGEFQDWALRFFAQTGKQDRDANDLGELARRMLADSKLSKVMFQFPSLVTERMCHAMKLHHYTAYGQFLGDGEEITSAYIVVHGALRALSHVIPESGQSSNKVPLRSAMTPTNSLEQDRLEQLLPGDIFGALELVEYRTTASKVVYVEAGTLLLSIPKVVFERWLAPLFIDTIYNAGSLFERLEDSDGRAFYADKRIKPITSPNRRQSLILASTDTSETQLKVEHIRALDEVANLLKRMGIFPFLPRFILAEILRHASVVRKQAGDVLFHEGEESQYLVVILTGFISFYSLEHMSTTLEMFQKHTFCRYSSFRGSQTNPEDFVADGEVDMSTNRAAAMAKHRAAMHGTHIQTLHAHNAFRTGVLLGGTICPATVIAQTNCECLVLDETTYMHVLKVHSPSIDLSKLNLPLTVGDSHASHSELEANGLMSPPGSLRSIVAQHNPMTLHPALMKVIEHTSLPWLTRSPLKLQQLVRSMRYISAPPGERLIRFNDKLDYLIIVLSGKLTLHIRPSDDVSSVLDASQRSVRSLMLERSVTSNYSTTSQQLYKETGAHARGRIGSLQDAFAKRKIIRNKITRISGVVGGSGLFLDSVLAAVNEERLLKARIPAVIEEPKPKADFLSPKSEISKDRRQSRPSLLLQFAASKANLQQKLDIHRGTGTASLGHERAAGSLFLCHLGPGEVYGEEILSPLGSYRSAHDVFVEASTPSITNSKSAGSSATTSTAPGGAQLLLLPRELFHSINSKSDAEIEKESHVRSKLAKIKWHKAEQKITRKLSQATVADQGKTPKLFDFFKNILNQRCFLTMRAIADISLLRDLSDSNKRELCLAARFEALERHMNAYKENGANSSGPRYYILLSGRIGLFAKNLNSSFFSHSSGNSISNGVASATAMPGTENCLREILAGDGFGEFEILVPEFSRSIAAVALEPCRLLSFPAAMFLKHWPHIPAMRSAIEYVRTRVPFFSRLELEKIACLYHTLSFQTFTRGSNIFEQNNPIASHSTVGELYLLKEGVCSIRQRVVLDTNQLSSKHPRIRSMIATIAEQTKHQSRSSHIPETHSCRVMVTVADVTNGHLFWIDASVFPFTLQAVSASVTMTSISIDKLKAILPRTQLLALEQSSDQMAALYNHQYEMAKRAVVTLMNEKRAAQMGMTPNPTFLPLLDFQSPQKVIQSPVVITKTSHSPDPNTTRAGDTAIPFSRLLMAKPIDLVALRDQERQEISVNWEGDHNLDATSGT
uniref:Cyclic nucleotide-binding domain-containing protein n=1 Tax=Globisporangium ultimum (strain ATCC 200006 / CBS 805.95 / DAOM BR144) TaxID=431595 RepID=K3WET3_GLOUD